MLNSVSLHQDAIIGLDPTGAPAIISCKDIEWSEAPNTITSIDIILSDANFIVHYFHFIEMSIAILTVISKCIPHAKIRNIYFGNQIWINKLQNYVQKDIVKAWFDPEKIVEGEPSEQDSFSHFVVLLSDRCGPIDSYYNKYFVSIIAQARDAFPIFRSKALAYATDTHLDRSITQPLNTRPVGSTFKNLYKMWAKPKAETSFTINETDNRALTRPSRLYVRRKPPRTFESGLEDRFLQMFTDRGIELEVIDFSNMTWAEQVKSTSRAELLVGIHGNGLTNCLWMPSGATVIEIFPEDTHHYDYQILCEVAGLNYFGIEGRAKNPFIYTSGSRFGETHGYVGVPVKDLPWEWLSQILDGLKLTT